MTDKDIIINNLKKEVCMLYSDRNKITMIEMIIEKANLEEYSKKDLINLINHIKEVLYDGE